MNQDDYYQYSLLKYCHSQVLGELINIGIIIYFPKRKQVSMLVTENLARLKFLYPDFSEKLIKSYLEFFKERLDQISSNSKAFYEKYHVENFRKFISEYLLPNDSSQLKFDSPRSAIMTSDEVNTILHHLKEKYLPSQDVKDYIFTLQKKRYAKEDWILPELTSKISKIESDYVYLPDKNNLSF